VKNTWQMIVLVDEKPQGADTVSLPVLMPPAMDGAKFDLEDILRWEDDGGPIPGLNHVFLARLEIQPEQKREKSYASNR
jgi:hypothetical protein